MGAGPVVEVGVSGEWCRWHLKHQVFARTRDYFHVKTQARRWRFPLPFLHVICAVEVQSHVALSREFPI
jgi:hypothetical protein